MRTVFDLEIRANGYIESFNVEGIFVAAHFPYKHATAIKIPNGNILELSGMLGFNEKGIIPEPNNPFLQTKYALQNIALVISAALVHYNHNRFLSGEIETLVSLEFIISTRVDLKNIKDISEVNKAYKEVGVPYAARTAIETGKLPLDALVEITATAFIPKAEQTFTGF
ncbi:MAG: RidA family protein [Nanoarchaeota archaeon]|nr:RidA family protein [Nanoarchaeota archaeon]